MKYGTTKNNSITQFPITEREWRKTSGISMRKWSDCTEADLKRQGIVRVYEGSRPETADRTHTARLDTIPTLNGERWEQQWIVTENTNVEVARYDDHVRRRIKHEAEDRIVQLVPEWKQRNALARSLELLRKGEANLTPTEQTEVAQVDALWLEIKRIRSVSDTLEAVDPPPEDYSDDKYWIV
jgi:hypothetical protein